MSKTSRNLCAFSWGKFSWTEMFCVKKLTFCNSDCEGKELQNLQPIPIQSHFYFLGWIVVRTESQSSGILCSAGRDTETYCLLIENRKLIQTNANALKENRKLIQTNTNVLFFWGWGRVNLWTNISKLQNPNTSASIMPHQYLIRGIL